MIASLAELKLYLGITDSSQDTLLTMLLEAADAYVKRYTCRDWEEATYTDIFNGKGEQTFNVNQYPVTAITSFQYNESKISSPSWTDFDADSYSYEESTGRIFLLFTLPKGLNNIRLVYTA